MTKKITLREAEKLRIQHGATESDILTAEEIAGIQDTESLKRTAQQQSGRVLNDLLRSSAQGDTQASKEILERGHGKVPQAVAISGEFTIKALHAHVMAELTPPDKPTDTPQVPAAGSIQ